MFKKILKKNKWVTLLELMLSMGIFAMIMIIVMSSVQSMMATRIKTMNRIALTDELYFFAEQLFTEIKNGGTLDYEEYWNRKMVGTGAVNGRYQLASGVGNYGLVDGHSTSPWWYIQKDQNNNNYGTGFYYCRSTDNEKVDGNGCTSASLNSMEKNQFLTNTVKKFGEYQRYGQYALQFWDYNANHNGDNGDQNSDGNIIGDEDDRNLYRWPKVFENQANNPIHELYLINTRDTQNPTRTFFRWDIIDDPNRPTWTTCTKTASWGIFTAGDGCIGQLQILKMRWYDYGMQHDRAGTTAFDGNIDTWICEKGWTCKWPEILWTNWSRLATGLNDEYINLFPNSITVRKFRLEAYPERDPWLAAAEPDCPQDGSQPNCISPFIHPYVRISLEIGFTHGKRRALKNENPVASLQTTINLDDFR